MYLKKMYPKVNFILTPDNVKNVPNAIVSISKKYGGYKNLIMIAGEDRTKGYIDLINKFNTGHVLYDDAQVISGPRTKGISGTDLRNHARDGNFDAFYAGVGVKDEKLITQMFNDVRAGMGIVESYSLQENKFKTIWMLAGMLGVINPEMMDPKDAIESGLKKVLKMKLSPEMIGIIKDIFQTAKGLGISIDKKLIPRVVGDYLMRESTDQLQRIKEFIYNTIDQKQNDVVDDEVEREAGFWERKFVKEIVDDIVQERSVMGLFDNIELIMVNSQDGEIEENVQCDYSKSTKIEALNMIASTKKAEDEEESGYYVTVKEKAPDRVVEKLARQLAVRKVLEIVDSNIATQKMLYKDTPQSEIADALQKRKASMITTVANKVIPMFREIEKEMMDKHMQNQPI